MNRFAVYAASARARPFAFPFLVYHSLLALALLTAAFFVLFMVNPAENKAFAAIPFGAAVVVIVAAVAVNTAQGNDECFGVTLSFVTAPNSNSMVSLKANKI